ncbi:hypothetical protein Tco_0138095 [Tanacetum coccineum]
MARLFKWKAKKLFIGGRLTLTKSVLSTISLYYFSLFKVPIGVLKNLESCRSIFFRGVEPGMRKVSWFSWDSVVASKEVRGLGMSSFFAMNCALLFKWIWRFKVQPKATWVSVIKAIHGRLGNLDRGVTVEENKEVSIRDKVHNGLLHGFRRSPRGEQKGDGVFKVSSARRYIDKGLCENGREAY